eukprot:scaffold5443_cov291-Pinguiococcus_pyrenoidosus.AAC.17
MSLSREVRHGQTLRGVLVPATKDSSTGNGVRVKKDNWQQLEKLFKKLGLQDLSDADEVRPSCSSAAFGGASPHHLLQIQKIIYCGDGAAVAFVNKAYESLTNRKVQIVKKPAALASLPPFAKDTAGSLVRNATARLPEDADIKSTQNNVLEKLEEHERTLQVGLKATRCCIRQAHREKHLQEERGLDPERFSNTSRVRRARGSPKVQSCCHNMRCSAALSLLSVANCRRQAVSRKAPEVPAVCVKSIRVKQVDRSMAQIRSFLNSSDASAPSAESPSSSKEPGRSQQLQAGAKEGGMKPSGWGGAESRVLDQTHASDTLKVLNQCVAQGLSKAGESEKLSLLPGEAPIHALLAQVTRKREDQVSDASLVQVLSEVQRQAGSIVHSIVMASPGADEADAVGLSGRYWVVSDVFCVLLNELDKEAAPETHAKAVHAFESIGAELSLQDASVAVPLFLDFTLPRLRSRMESSMLDVRAAMRVFSAHVGDASAPSATPRLATVRMLQGALDHADLFLQCLSVMCGLENEIGEDLLDLYMDYAIAGMSRPKQILRAAAVSMVPSLIRLHPKIASRLLERVRSLVWTDTSAETQAHIALACTALLRADFEGLEDERSAAWETLAITSGPRAEVTVRQLAIAELAELTNPSEPRTTAASDLGTAAARMLVDIVADLPDDARARTLVSDADFIPSGLRMSIRPPARLWSSLTIAKAIVSKVQNREEDETAAEKEISDDPAENMSLALVHLLATAVAKEVELTHETEGETGSVLLREEYVEIYNDLKDHLFVAVCDVDCVDFALDVLRGLILNSSLQADILREPRLQGILRLLFPTASSGIVADKYCQTQMESFLKGLHAAGDPWAAAINEQVDCFEASFPDIGLKARIV